MIDPALHGKAIPGRTGREPAADAPALLRLQREDESVRPGQRDHGAGLAPHRCEARPDQVERQFGDHHPEEPAGGIPDRPPDLQGRRGTGTRPRLAHGEGLSGQGLPALDQRLVHRRGGQGFGLRPAAGAREQPAIRIDQCQGGGLRQEVLLEAERRQHLRILQRDGDRRLPAEPRLHRPQRGVDRLHAADHLVRDEGAEYRLVLLVVVDGALVGIGDREAGGEQGQRDRAAAGAQQPARGASGAPSGQGIGTVPGGLRDRGCGCGTRRHGVSSADASGGQSYGWRRTRQGPRR